ncbi:hypothetical protein [Acrocarpospora sp. B8E8]|uniref:hypothetical protein n=1 Tax=Acrocarpospora sp. B8E8 TaxID=3153572 RepID=UPI00325E4991
MRKRAGGMLRRIDHLVGYRGSVLLFLALQCAASAVRLARPAPEVVGTTTYTYLASIAPLWTLAIPWAVVCVLCLVYAFRDDDKVAFGAIAGLTVFWSVVYLIGGLVGAIPQAYWQCIVQIVLAGLVLRISGWPEPVRER